MVSIFIQLFWNSYCKSSPVCKELRPTLQDIWHNNQQLTNRYAPGHSGRLLSGALTTFLQFFWVLLLEISFSTRSFRLVDLISLSILALVLSTGRAFLSIQLRLLSIHPSIITHHYSSSFFSDFSIYTFKAKPCLWSIILRICKCQILCSCIITSAEVQ
jgi:hypothetical protein